MGTTPSGTHIRKGDTVRLSWRSNCGVYGTWKKDEKVLAHGGRVSISHKDFKHFSLEVKDARQEDEGNYTLELSNRKARVSGSAAVTLLEFDTEWRGLFLAETDEVKKTLEAFKVSNSEVRCLRFLLQGPVGVGKSSIINTINSVFQGQMVNLTPTDAATGKSHTIAYQAYPIEDAQKKSLPFVFNDIMGLENEKESGALIADIISALKGRVKDGYKFNASSALTETDFHYNSAPSLADKVHCLVTVIHANNIFLFTEEDDAIQKMKQVRKAARDLGVPDVVFMTHVDHCCPLVKKDLNNIYLSKRIKAAMQRCSDLVGVPMNCIFPVKNYHQETKGDAKTECLILHALDKAVKSADDFVRVKSSN
ncbi:interferon-induced protein 44-like isoform X2 [Engraulis encrasicolus]|uniref:interferon-induced protein 44-like isoform X2 n=1 Tax=Engraulis encrasicolus TaxID=184585 RepID=UPI002FCF9C93